MNQIPFASNYANPAGSPIRELFPYLKKPGLISFAGGYPSPSLFDAEGLQEAGRRALADSTKCLQYGATEGIAELKEELAELCATRGIHRESAHFLITTGSQQGFDLLVRILIETGDTVYVETPGYPAAPVASTMRLSYAAPNVDEIQDGVARLEMAFQDAMQ